MRSKTINNVIKNLYLKTELYLKLKYINTLIMDFTHLNLNLIHHCDNTVASSPTVNYIVIKWFHLANFNEYKTLSSLSITSFIVSTLDIFILPAEHKYQASILERHLVEKRV